MNVTTNEVLLLCEALTMAASRHEAQSRFNPRGAAPHDKKAAAMRALKTKLMKLKLKDEAA